MDANLEGVQAYNGGTPALNTERFANRRSEDFWILAQRFRDGDICIPRDDRLVAQLCGLTYGITSGGRTHIAGKEEMRNRGLVSPDRADGLCMAFAPKRSGSFLDVEDIQGAMSDVIVSADVLSAFD